MKDLFGLAILDYQTNNAPENIITETNISDADEMSVGYLFRTFEQMPAIEQAALDFAFGRVLDVGCGAGSHSLCLQKTKNLETVAIDISQNAIQACGIRGVKNAFTKDIFLLNESDFGLFDTILLLMNGTGICGTLKNLHPFLQKLKSLLSENGQILIDSSDIIYMYDQDNLGNPILENNDKYYGELKFYISYKNQREKSFDWLFIDFENLKIACLKYGLHCEKIIEGTNHDYLARITAI